MPTINREIRLKSRPAGLPKAGNFEVVDVPMPVARDDEVLVRNLYTRVSASLRMMIGEGAEDVEGVPFPALRPGVAGQLAAAAPSGIDVLIDTVGGEQLQAAVNAAREGARRMGRSISRMVPERRLRFPHVLVEGIARGPEALQHVAEGRYFGMTVVEL